MRQWASAEDRGRRSAFAKAAQPSSGLIYTVDDNVVFGSSIGHLHLAIGRPLRLPNFSDASLKEIRMFKHILVPTDGSPLSTDTVKRAIGFAKEISARITFLFAKPDYPVAFYGEGALIDPTTPEKFAEMAERQAREILASCELMARENGVSAAAASITNDIPYEAIIDAADANGCDLIFMASHGRRGLSGLLLGSETQKVLTHSSIPVLVYR
jgi:nucleotide-binding universal stress UspA family protein